MRTIISQHDSNRLRRAIERRFGQSTMPYAIRATGNGAHHFRITDTESGSWVEAHCEDRLRVTAHHDAAFAPVVEAEAPAMVPQVAQLQQANAGRAAVSPEHRDTADAFHSTDAAWQNALTAQFGRKASEIRYTAAGAGEPGSELRRLYSDRYRAYAAWAELRGLGVMPDPLCESAPIKAPRNSATYCDGKAREFTAVLLDGDSVRYAAIAGQTCSDPLDCVALTESEAHEAGRVWALKRITRVGTDPARFYRVERLPAGWSNDGRPAPVMVPQPCQQPQAKARGPARGERRYVEVRDTETGETHRVLTSVATVGVAVVIFTPSNRHRAGALGGMLITHDNIRKAWVFNDEAEARRMLSRNSGPGERVIRAELIADPAR